MQFVETDLLFLRDAYLRTFDAKVVETDGDRVALDRTAFYPTGGGQPNDTLEHVELALAAHEARRENRP